MTPYFDDGQTCECGCGDQVTGVTRRGPRRFVSGHNLRRIERTPEHRARIAEALRESWRTRDRMPIGATRPDSDGYILVKAGPGHWRKQHTLVVEAATGRPLPSGHVVHHVNGVKDDNHLDNLYPCSSPAHYQAHASLLDLLPGLLDEGVVVFDREIGRYRRGR